MHHGVKAGGESSKAKGDICRSDTYHVLAIFPHVKESHTRNNRFFVLIHVRCKACGGGHMLRLVLLLSLLLPRTFDVDTVRLYAVLTRFCRSVGNLSRP